ncbi:hypothetical protein SAMN05421760_1011041 [Neptunomonas antarctica]|uniref:Right handed beta helix region n=2 Tax=Neptunomonas antarctica TaxID=619304 RepID=A0A1N7JEN7_9GAMM|nr:hypothetical protein SAMN05421760_1011041 [Neptunomonas antarctica]
MKHTTRLIILYFAGAGLVGHLMLFTLYIAKPEIVKKGYTLATDKIKKHIPFLSQLSGHHILVEKTLEEEIAENFPTWSFINNPELPLLGIQINDQLYSSLKEAAQALKDGDTLIIGEGLYQEPLVIKANNITVIGNGHVILESTEAEGKGAIITKGSNTRIVNIECRNIQVRDKNGSCVRHEGINLTLQNVYFHNSEQGLLTGSKPGIVEINDSRFEQLGKNGQAHGVYIGGGQLKINNSLFIAAKSEGHEIKSRAELTQINNSIIASFSSLDSRLIDIPDGGVLEIKNSVLEQGPTSENGDMIGYALEKSRHSINKIQLINNIFILERNAGNTLLHQKNSLTDTDIRNNIIIASQQPELSGFNLFFKTREEAGLEPYPLLPQKISTKE